MTQRITILAVAGLLVVLAGACGGGERPAAEGPAPVTPAGDPSPGDGSFVGLSLDEASSRADAEGRPWRLGRLDDERFALTQDYVVGRVTFEVDDGLVTTALIEGESRDDADRGALAAAAVERIVEVDNSFGGGTPFERVEVASAITSQPSSRFSLVEREQIAASIQDVAEVEFVDDPAAAIERYFDTGDSVAVVSVAGLKVDADRAEIEVELWCGSVCGVFLTYEAERTDAGWQILGTRGPIAVS